MNDSEKAKRLLREQGYTCVLCKGDAVYTSRKTGIAPMMDFLDSGAELSGFCAADRIVGRAAAMLFVLAGVCAVHAEVITDGAALILEESGIFCTWDTRTGMIVNRSGDGPCPMEEAVKDVTDPILAREKIRLRLKSLTKK